MCLWGASPLLAREGQGVSWGDERGIRVHHFIRDISGSDSLFKKHKLCQHPEILIGTFCNRERVLK